MKITDLKRVGIISFSVLVAIGIYGLKDYQNENTVSTMSVPVTNKVIVIDSGHRAEKMVEPSVQMELVKRI